MKMVGYASSPPKIKGVHASVPLLFLRQIIRGESNAVKKQHSVLFLNGDRRILRGITSPFLLHALAKSKSESPSSPPRKKHLLCKCFFRFILSNKYLFDLIFRFAGYVKSELFEDFHICAWEHHG